MLRYWATAATPAFAQDAQPEEEARPTEVIQVIGLRASLMSSVATKREETSIVEAITAEDIGRLPDVSIAESLARLPGLAAQRLDGRAQVISVRGLGPDFTTALLNGREQVSTGDNRGVEFDQYPSELLSSVVIYKTPDGSLIGQGLAGTADLRTVRPLQQSERVVAVNASYEWSDLGALNAGSSDTGYRGSLAYIDQNRDGTIGIALGAAFINTPTQAERWNAWGYPQVSDGGPFVIGGAKPYVQSNELERLGLMGVLQFQPNDRFNATVDLYYSNFDETQTLRGIEFPLAWGEGTALRDGFTVEDGLVVDGVFDNVHGVVRNDLNRFESDLFAGGVNFEFAVGDAWTADIDLSYSRAERTSTILETNSGTGFQRSGPPDALGFTFPSGGGSARFSSIIDYADPNLIRLTSPQGWGGDIFLDNDGNPAGQAGFLNSPTIEDELAAVRFGMSRDLEFGAFDSLSFGMNYSDRRKDKWSNQFFIGLANGENEAAIPSELLMAPTELAFLGIPGMVSYDPLALMDSGVLRMERNVNADVVTGDWGVQERVTTLYGMLGIDSQLGQVPVTGNVGLQAVHTEQSSNGFRATDPGEFGAVTDGASYWEWLPSANLSFEIADSTFIRVAAARTLARARMDQMRASEEVFQNLDNVNSTDINNAYWGGASGSPDLKPWIANALDVSLERYFGGTGYVAVAAFYKDLETYIYEQTTVGDFSGLEARGGAEPALDQGLVTRPMNGDGGYIRGLEASLSVPFELIHPVLDGFGFIGNASFTESEIESGGPGSATPIPGLSEEVINLTLYYERGGFESRISSRYRSDFLGEVSGFGAGRELRTVQAETVVDAQIGYRFDHGPLDGLALRAQVYNLTDEEFQTFEGGDPRRVIDYQRYGRTFLLGASYRF
jgi:iron complex outermembrane recepter protein